MEKYFEGFSWDAQKELANISKHGIDSKHSVKEKRYFCIGKSESKILTVRFTYCANKIRIIGVGYWRKGKKYYEET